MSAAIRPSRRFAVTSDDQLLVIELDLAARPDVSDAIRAARTLGGEATTRWHWLNRTALHLMVEVTWPTRTEFVVLFNPARQRSPLDMIGETGRLGLAGVVDDLTHLAAEAMVVTIEGVELLRMLNEHDQQLRGSH